MVFSAGRVFGAAARTAGTPMTSTASVLAQWAHDLDPTDQELALADRSLLDTMAVTLAARDHPVARIAASVCEAGQWGAAAHVRDLDDLHMPSPPPSTTFCAPAPL